MRKPLLTSAIFQLHLWGGLALGIYAFLIGITGSVLVFREEVVRLIAPIPAITQDRPPASMEQIRLRIQKQYPEWHAWSLEPPREPGRPWSSYLLGRGKGRLVFADGQGNVVGERHLDGTWFELFEKFHSHLLIQKGRLYNGVAGLLLTVLTITGAVLWWPAKGEWSEAFRIIRRSNWKGVVYDLHRVGGALTFLFVMLFSVTGSYFTWPAVYRQIVGKVLPMKPKPEVSSMQFSGMRQPVDALVASARQVLPGAELVRVLVPQGGKQPVRVVFGHGAAHEHYKTSQVSVHPQTAEVLAVDAYSERKAGDHVASLLGPLHTGSFGGPAVKAIWALAGLALPGLFVTGFLMWLNRVLVPRIRRRKSMAARAAQMATRS